MCRLYLVSTLFLLLLGVAAACQTVPITGRSQLMLLPEFEEMRMGLQAYQEILSKSKVSHDPGLNDLVTRVGTRIARATGRLDYRWEFTVIEDSKQVNAFALPGGKVAVYTGILPVTRDEAGLATVMGHEVAHATARHGGERVSQGLLVQVGLAATQAAMATRDPRTVQQVTGLLGAGAAVGVILPFSRAQESEADHLGLIYMAKAGYDPRAAVSFWQRMEQAAQGRRSPPEFLSTHPSHGARIRQIEQWIPEAMQYYQGSR
ncbi:MAG: M48 family metallopeptidase [Candidatus Rokubacteria bacterium]|nr:M48 family metallopeptidase [Candidatus Rokubacteria bacterium]